MYNLKFLLFLGSFLVLLACHTARMQPAPTPPVMVQPPTTSAFVTWDKMFVELGAVKKGEKRTMTYTLTNVSNEAIKIELVDACSCTKVEFPRGSMAPGEKGRLDVTFDSAEKDAAETIELRVIFQNTDARGYPRLETLKYHFDLVK